MGRKGCDVTELDEAGRRRYRHRSCIEHTDVRVRLSAWIKCLQRVSKVPSLMGPEMLGAMVPDSRTHIGQGYVCR